MIIDEETDNLKEKNQMLEAKILDFRVQLNDRSFKMDGDGRVYANVVKWYDEYFGITNHKNGKI